MVWQEFANRETYSTIGIYMTPRCLVAKCLKILMYLSPQYPCEVGIYTYFTDEKWSTERLSDLLQEHTGGLWQHPSQYAYTDWVVPYTMSRQIDYGVTE